ncbi:hypothetical protein [Vibrio sp. TRT 29B02]|uniref:hypothetical protein n=1 Tax=Vibrio sp. TRT 29B02 TaxID=3418508 RepID=UPI003CE96F59
MSSFKLILTSRATASLSLSVELTDAILTRLTVLLESKGISVLVGLRRIHLRAKYGAHHESFVRDIESACSSLLEA